MKKWLIALCCVLIAAAVAFVTVVNNKNTSIDTLNKDLSDIQAEYNTLKDKNEKNEKTIQELNQQVDELTAEKDGLNAENGRLNETLEGLNRNLSSSQQKLQGVMYILTDGAEGKIDSILSPFMKIFQDVGTDSAYFEAVNYVHEHKLMDPIEDEVFGVSEKATLGEFADSLHRLQGERSSSIEEAVTELLEMEQVWLAKLETAEEAAEEPDEANEETVEEPAEATAETAEEPAEAMAETAEEPADAMAETADDMQEAATEEADEVMDEAAAELTEETAEASEETSEDTAPEAEEPIEEATEEDASEKTVETAEKDSEDETLVLTKERILSFCNAVCSIKGTEMPEIIFPDAEADAVRGDLAIVLMKLAQAE